MKSRSLQIQFYSASVKGVRVASVPLVKVSFHRFNRVRFGSISLFMIFDFNFFSIECNAKKCNCKNVGDHLNKFAVLLKSRCVVQLFL